MTCSMCGHAESLHNKWGICNEASCEPCYKELKCPQCKHTFFDHAVSESWIRCLFGECPWSHCFNAEKSLGNLMNIHGQPLFHKQPTYEEALSPHPLVPVRTVAVAPEDKEIAPGVYNRYAEGRKWDNTKGGWIIIDLMEQNENGTFKNWATGRTWETRLGGYVPDIVPGPPEVGYIA